MAKISGIRISSTASVSGNKGTVRTTVSNGKTTKVITKTAKAK